MNPLTNVKNITKLNEIELAKGTVDKKSWHDMYKESAWIFIGGLAYGLTEGDILAVFSQYGEIVNINLVRDKKTGKTKGFCFLCYANQKSTILAVDNLNGIKLLGRTIRVDHVANYKPPKDNENDDDLTKQLKSEGCAPRPIKLEASPVQTEKISKKEKAKKEKKKHKKKKKKSEKEALRKNIKQEKMDPGYDKYENLHDVPGTSSQARKRKISESESTESESTLNDSYKSDNKQTKYAERNSQKLGHKSGRKELKSSHKSDSENRNYSRNRNNDDSESKSTESESSLSDSYKSDSKPTKYAERNFQKLSHKSGRKELKACHKSDSENRNYSENKNNDESGSEFSENFNVERKSKENRAHIEDTSRNHFHLNKNLTKDQYYSTDDSCFKNTSSKSSRKKDEPHSNYHSRHHSSKTEYTSETLQKERKRKQHNSSSDDDSLLAKNSSNHHKYDNLYHKERYRSKEYQVDSNSTDNELKKSTKISHSRSYSRENDKYYSKSSKKDYDKDYKKK